MSITEALTIEVALAIAATIFIGRLCLQLRSRLPIGNRRIRIPRQDALTEIIVEREPVIKARRLITDGEWSTTKDLINLCGQLRRENIILTALVKATLAADAGADNGISSGPCLYRLNNNGSQNQIETI